jgi:XTP/dITP diphosphohydrolase
MVDIVFATGNKSKLSQIKFLIEHLKLPINIISGKEKYGSLVKYEEIGNSSSEIALNGVATVFSNIQLPVIVEDSILQVPTLDNRPGVRSATYLSDHGRYGLLQEMENKPDRKAFLHSSVAFAASGIEPIVFNTILEGIIATEEIYDQNFPDWISPNENNHFGGGFNAIFIPNGYDVTLAQISPEDAIPWSYRESSFNNCLNYILHKIPLT